MAFSIPLQRLHSQLLAGNFAASPHEVVAHLGAVQAQDPLAAAWAIGARMKSATEADIDRAVIERRIVRCWPMRGTLHYVAAEDARWMLELLAPGVLQRHRTRLERDFELDPKTLRRCGTVIERALAGGNALTRAEMYARLEQAKIATANSRGLQILFALAHERLIVFGARQGKQPTFVLLDEWLPPAQPKPREEALGELARRYFRGHGPAQLVDFAWWAGLSPKEAKEAMALGGEEARHAESKRGRVHLLPAFDEYTVAYRDRSDILDAQYAARLNAGGGMLKPVVVADGRVVGTWQRTLRGKRVEIALSLFDEVDARAVEREKERYANFVGASL